MRRWLGVILCMVLLTGCGGAGPAGQSTESTPSMAASATPYVITMAPPTPNPVVEASVHSLGHEDAPVSIVLYGDYQCESCGEVALNLAEVQAEYPELLRIAWHHFPDMVSHDKAEIAMLAAEAAGEQGAFWAMHDLLFVEQANWADLPPEIFSAQLAAYAETLGLNAALFAEAMAQDPGPLAEQFRLSGFALDIRSIPAVFVNGEAYNGRTDVYGLAETVRFFALEARHYDVQPDFTIDQNKNYHAILHTEHGDITIDLFADLAPVAVNNFVFLARDGWYDGITFHRVLPGLLAQTGDPSGTGLGDPGYTIADEHDNGLTFDRAGMVAMVGTRDVLHSAGSQFFISYGPLTPAREWDDQYTIFGLVTDGFDVLSQITSRDAQTMQNPPPGDMLLSVEIIEQDYLGD